jgi:hypothetical protein
MAEPGGEVGVGDSTWGVLPHPVTICEEDDPEAEASVSFCIQEGDFLAKLGRTIQDGKQVPGRDEKVV